jgi:lysophospholipase L1-like esterase
MRRVWGRLALVLALCALGVSAALAQGPAIGTDITNVLPDVLALVGKQDAPGKLLLKPGDKVAFMGDSITAGGGYVRLANFIINAHYADIKPVFINAGISGHKAENMEPRFESQMKLAEKPAVCFINVGINDVWHRLGAPHDQAVLDKYKENVTKMVDRAQAVGAQVVLLTPTLIQEDANNEGNKRLLLYVDAMKQVAAEKQCAVADLHALFITALAAKPAALKLTGDGVHMNPYGDAIMALGVLRALGVPDEKFAASDVMPAFQVRALGMSLTKAAEVLEVPPTRFFKPELLRFVGF